MTNEILSLNQEQIAKFQKSFSTVKVQDNKVIVKDWLDDSVQIVAIKKEEK